MLVSVAMAGIVSTVIEAHPAFASAQPFTAWSFYVEVANNSHGDGAMQTLGCNQAHSQNSSHYNSEVILDFGAMVNSSGEQETVNGYILSQTDVEALTEWFGNGYRGCSPSYQNIVDIGTNNSRTLTQAEGTAFAHTVNAVSSWMATYSPHQAVYGANDIETFCPNDCQTPTATYNWYAGYQGAAVVQYVDYGSADGCTLDYTPTCSDGWAKGDYYNLCWREALAECAPEIYYNVNAEQWHYISGYGQGFGGAILPQGPLDEYDLNTGTNTAAQAWSDLNAYFPTMYYSLEVHIAS